MIVVSLKCKFSKKKKLASDMVCSSSEDATRAMRDQDQKVQPQLPVFFEEGKGTTQLRLRICTFS